MSIESVYPAIVTDEITGYAPLTVHLHDSVTAGSSSWDFGDDGRVNSSSNNDVEWHVDNALYKTRCPERVLGNGMVDVSGYLVSERDIDLNTDQKGKAAAYTYYEPGTYTVSLNNTSSPGLLPSNDTITVVVSDPAPGSYPIVNGITGWTKITINNSGSTGGSDFTAAITNANTAGEKVIIEFASGITNIYLDAGVIIDCSHLVIRPAADERVEISFSLNGGVVRDGVDLITISDTSQNITFEGISFRSHDDSSVASTDSLHMDNYDPSSHSSIKGIVSADDIGTTARGITFQYCAFWNFTRGIDIEGGTGLFLSNISLNRHDGAHIRALMDNVVVSDVICGTNTQNPPAQTMVNDFSVGDPEFILQLGGASRASVNHTIQFCNINYRGDANYETFDAAYPAASTYDGSNDSGTFCGAFELTRVSGATIYRSAFQEGTNSLSYDSSNLSIFQNYFSTGGMSAALEINDGTTDATIYSNAFEISQGKAQAYLIASRDTLGSTIDDITIVHNTFLLSKDISKNGAALYFEFPGTVASSALTFSRNLVVDNHTYQARVIWIDDSDIISLISNNVYFAERPNVDFAKYGGVDYDYSEWVLNVEDSALIERVEWRFMTRNWAMCPDPVKHDELNSNQASNPSVFFDFANYEFGSIEKPSIGCTRVDVSSFGAGSGNAFTITANITNRTDRAASGVLDKDGNPFSSNPGDNVEIMIVDPDNGYTVMDSYSDILLTTDSGSQLSDVGLYIRTDITNLSTTDDAVSFTLTYTNDGPVGQTYYERLGFSAEYLSLSPQEQIDYADNEYFFTYSDNDVDNTSLGQLNILQANLGNLYSLYQGYRGTGFSIKERFAGNIFNLSNRTYPGNKYCPCAMAFNREYAICASAMWDTESETKGLTFFENAGNTFSSNNALNVNFSWRNSYSITNPLTNSSSTGNTPFYLEEGESFSLDIAIKVTRDSRYNHVQTASPYKTFFENTYGERQYTADPRPLRGSVLQQSEVLTFPSNVYGYSSTFARPDQNGWQSVRDGILDYELLYGYERVIMWPPGGNYLVNQGGNFPFLMWSPFYDSNQRSFEEFFATKSIPSDVQAYHDADIADGGDGIIDDDYPGGSFTAYPVQSYFDELNLMQDLNFEYPNMGYYWGRATQISRTWDSSERFYYDSSDQEAIDLFNAELDLMASTFRGRNLGMDAFHASRYGLIDRNSSVNTSRRRYPGPQSQELALMRNMIARWPHMKIGTELALNDVYHLLGTMFYFNSGSGVILRETNFMADYLVPGHESWSAFRFDLRTEDWGDRFDQTDDQRRYMMKEIAGLGFSTLSYNDVDLRDGQGNGYSASDFLATDRRGDFETVPSDGEIPAQPSRFTYLIDDSRPLFDSNYIRLRWDANEETDIRFYKVQKARMVNGSPDTGDFMTIDYTVNNEYFDVVIKDTEQYVYRVVAVDFDGNESTASEYSVLRVANTAEIEPPISVRAQAVSQNTSIKVNWQEPG